MTFEDQNEISPDNSTNSLEMDKCKYATLLHKELINLYILAAPKSNVRN